LAISRFFLELICLREAGSRRKEGRSQHKKVWRGKKKDASGEKKKTGDARTLMKIANHDRH